jgi:hypothetical protein
VTKSAPTIKRRKSWPRWARWYAIDRHGYRGVYSTKPVLGYGCNDQLDWIFGDKAEAVRGPRRIRGWRQSLRRIVT